LSHWYSRNKVAQPFLILTRNVSGAANQHIIMIYEGSCDTEDWSNDAENSTWSSMEKKVILNCNNIHIYYRFIFTFFFYCIQIDMALLSIRDVFQT